jgi:hypothetical protein
MGASQDPNSKAPCHRGVAVSRSMESTGSGPAPPSCCRFACSQGGSAAFLVNLLRLHDTGRLQFLGDHVGSSDPNVARDPVVSIPTLTLPRTTEGALPPLG